jgi:hypothetical protein
MSDFTTYTSAAAIKVIRRHKGKAFVTIAGSEFMVAIEKADLIASMQTEADNGGGCLWSLRVAPFGLQIEAEQQ